MPTELFLLDVLQAYSPALVNRTWVTHLTEIRIWDVIAVHSHTVDMLPYTTSTVQSLVTQTTLFILMQNIQLCLFSYYHYHYFY